MSVYDYTGELGAWLKSLEEPSDGGLVNEEEEPPATVSSNDSDEELRKREREQLDPVEEIFSSMHDHVQSMYGDPKGWKGTPMEGLQGFAPASKREPIFGYTGQYDRGGNPEIRQRIDASTRYASPPSGLVGGRAAENQQKFGVASSFTPTAQWNKQFQRKDAPAGSSPLMSGSDVHPDAYAYNTTANIA